MQNDEVLIRVREKMSEREIVEVLKQLSHVQHRLIQISIDGGAKAHLPFSQILFQAAGSTEMAIFNLEQANAQKTGLLRPQ